MLIKFATRNRPEKFFKTLNIYYELLEGENYRFHITLDEDDTSMNNTETLARLKAMPNLEVFIGKSDGKIGAINRDISGEWDILLWAQDDMMPQVKGFNQIIKSDMARYFPDTDGVLWYNDGHQGENCCTLVIMGRKYYERTGYIYHNDYKGMWCDNEFGDVAKSLGKIQYIERVIIEHQHPIWIGEKYDAMLKRDGAYWNEDEATYKRRKSINFGL